MKRILITTMLALVSTYANATATAYASLENYTYSGSNLAGLKIVDFTAAVYSYEGVPPFSPIPQTINQLDSDYSFDLSTSIDNVATGSHAYSDSDFDLTDANSSMKTEVESNASIWYQARSIALITIALKAN